MSVTSMVPQDARMGGMSQEGGLLARQWSQRYV